MRSIVSHQFLGELHIIKTKFCISSLRKVFWYTLRVMIYSPNGLMRYNTATPCWWYAIAFAMDKKTLVLLNESFLAPPVGLEPTTCGLTVRRSTDWAKGEYLCSRYLFSRPVTRQLSSAYVCLTSVFGMGTGGPTRQSTRTLFDGLWTHLIMSKARRLLTTTL